MFDNRFDNLLFIGPALGIPLLAGNYYLYSFIGGLLEGRVNKTVTPDSTFGEILSHFTGKLLFAVGEPVMALVATVVTVYGGYVVYEYVIEEYLPRKKNKKKNRTMFKPTKLDYKQYEILIKMLEQLELLNLSDHTCPNKILLHKRIGPFKVQLKNEIQRILTYLSPERQESFSLGGYPEVFNRIAKEFHVVIPSLNQFITEYEAIKKLDLDEEHTEKVESFLKDITDCLINFSERILPEFQEAKHYKNAMLHTELDISNNHVKFEKGYLTKQEQFPEFIDQYEEGDPRIRELKMKMKTKTTTSIDLTKSPNNKKER
ncbi:hypothetical protein P8815_17945 [Bacillus altitudinis]|uniref:hypothetical protein n=1 Tax=Bacillus altitudinis TaxID=293387 RepID=UPI0020C0F8A4|nr:hypothetical protein [Bacillus altitudinis]MEC0473622.1 hypothetical protein [Bacillus altitudinis]